MMHNLTNNITNQKAKSILDTGTPLRSFTVNGKTEINAGSDWEKEVIIEDCTIENFNCLMVYFKKAVTIKNCHFKDAAFNFSYFHGGLTIENCSFDKYLDFEAGGHNNLGNLVVIRKNHFRGFVNFFDCWYTGEVIIEDNIFEKGTNVSSKDQLVSFDIPAKIINNTGEVALESECREEGS